MLELRAIASATRRLVRRVVNPGRLLGLIGRMGVWQLTDHKSVGSGGFLSERQFRVCSGGVVLVGLDLRLGKNVNKHGLRHLVMDGGWGVMAYVVHLMVAFLQLFLMDLLLTCELLMVKYLMGGLWRLLMSSPWRMQFWVAFWLVSLRKRVRRGIIGSGQIR